LWVVVFLVEHAFHPTLTGISSFSFKRGGKITLDAGLDQWLAALHKAAQAELTKGNRISL
jgi:flavin-dependent dehydrogenase